MKKSTRFISFFLAMVMILSLFTTVASAEEGENSNETETQQSDNTTTTQPIEVELFNDYESFDVQKAPDIITAAEIAQNGYIGRVKSHEKNLYTLVFRNSDGTNTKKIYSHPVKYVDDTGVVRDISLEIGQNKDGSFSTANHEIITTFEKNPLNGITLDYEDISIKMVPALTGNKVPAAAISSDNKKITYSLDSSTSYVYELTYTGYKEDIVVKKYTGQTEYMFKLYTNGLTLTKINETYCLTDSDGEIKAIIGDVIIFTADERNNTFGSITYQTVRQNQEYNITIHVDADYLRDPRTVYPIRIDPTIEIRYSNNGAGAIEDVTLNSNAGSDGSSTSLLIGKRNTYGISRVLLKVPALSFDGIPYAVSITSATIGIRDIMCQSSSLDIYCHQFTGGEWTESTANWSNVNPNSYGSCLDSHTVSYANGVAQPSDHSYLFDITSLVRQWYSNPTAQNMGVIFKASDTVEGASAHNHKTFGSYSSSYRPVFTLVYESVTPIIINFTTISLLEGESYTLAAGSSLSGAVISWSSADSNIARCGTYVGTSTTVTAEKAGTTTITATAHITGGFTYTASCEVSVYIPDGTYFLKNKQVGYYADILNSTMTSGTTVCQWSFTGADTQKWIFTRQSDGYYTIKSANSTTAYYLGVANDANSDGANIILRTGTVTNGMKWKISVTNSGAYRLTPKTGDWCLATNTSSQTNGTKLIQGDYVYNTSYRDEWNIRLTVYAFSVGGEFHNGEDVIDAAENWKLCGYSSKYDINPTVNALDYDGLNSEVVYFSSHGSQHRISLLNEVYLSDGLTTVTPGTVEIDNYTLPKAQLYIYDACLTASNTDGTGKNLCTETIATGVDCVIGWTKEIGVPDAYAWQTRFQSKLVAGASVKSAADYANTFSYNNNSTIKAWLIYGNQNLVINQNETTNLADSYIVNDSSLKCTTIQYDTYDINTLKEILMQEYENFSTDPAIVTITYTNREETDYVIDYYYTHAGFTTDSGYSIIVNNGYITHIRDNTIESTQEIALYESTSIPEITYETMVAASAQAEEHINVLGEEYSIVEQYADKYYDIIENKYYYRIMSVYKIPDGSYGAIFTMYEI